MVTQEVLVVSKKTFLSLQVTVFNPDNSWMYIFVYEVCFFQGAVVVIPSFKGFELISPR